MTNFIYPELDNQSNQIKAIQLHLQVVRELYEALRLYSGKFNYGIHGARILQIQEVLYSIKTEELTIVKILSYLLEVPFSLDKTIPKRQPVNPPLEFKFGTCSQEEIAEIYNNFMLVFAKYKKFPQSNCTEGVNKLLAEIKNFQ